MPENSEVSKILPLKQFLHYMCKDKRPERRFCFILGSGASVESGIETGATLANKWMEEIKQICEADNVKQWQQDKQIDDEDLAASYADIFDKRFELDIEQGYYVLEKAMEQAEPSCGYSILAQILTKKSEHSEYSQDNMVITTNFDSLTEDAIFIYSQKKPLVVGHEALAHYIKPFGSRPVIVKIHNDLLLSPKNSNDQIEQLHSNFKEKLKTVFQYYTPIVIGYGGNDGSLMGFLDQIPKPPNGIFWCYRPANQDQPKQHGLHDKITKLVTKLNGYIVPIPGFDSLFIQIGEQLGYGRYDQEIEKVAKARADKYREQIANLNAKHETNQDTQNAVTNLVTHGEKDWLYYDQLAKKETDLDKREAVYLAGLTALKDNPSKELYHNFANFLHYTKGDCNKAEQYYLLALEIDPHHIFINNGYANLLTDTRKDHDKAEKHYLIALENDPNYVTANNGYAILLANIRKDCDKAEKHYLIALENDPNNVEANNNYANLLKNIRKDYDKAEKHYLIALENDANHVHANNGYANLLTDIRKDHDKAEKHYRIALKNDPNHVFANSNYATLLTDIRKDYDKAEKHYLIALKNDPNYAIANSNYASFLTDIRKDYDKAEKHYLIALENDPNHVNVNNGYAILLTDIRKDYDKAEKHYLIALENDPKAPHTYGNYAKSLIAQHKLTKAKPYIDKAFELSGDNNKGLILVLHFYCYACYWQDYSQAKAQVEMLLDQGLHSPFWYLDDVVAVAQSLEHPQIDDVKTLAQRISAD